MNLNKQFINLLGAVVTLAILIAGIALIALPMWSQAQATDASTRTVAQTNSTYQAQIDQLSAAEARSEEIDAHLAELRAEIAPFTNIDRVIDIVDAAADKHDLTLESVTAADPEPFTPRTAATDETAQASAPASTDETAATDTTTTDPPAETAPAPAASESTGQQQMVITIKVPVPDAETATAFIDALRVGPRLIAISNATLEPGDGMLTVSALAFIRTED